LTKPKVLPNFLTQIFLYKKKMLILKEKEKQDAIGYMMKKMKNMKEIFEYSFPIYNFAPHKKM